MLTEERWASILEIVDREKAVSVPVLESLLGVSASTIRRDLTQLNRMGKLIKVHGGATSIETQYVGKDISMEEKYSMNNEEKQIIGRYAARLIGPEDFVYIDAGTTTELLVDNIREMRATYVTNSLTHALKLIHKGCRTYLPGGEVKNNTEAIIGGEALSYISRLHFTIGFWGTNGVTPETGFTTPDPHEALIKRVSMEQCTNRYILCDRSKFSVVSPITFAEFENATVITGKLTDKKYKKYENIVEVTK